MISTNPGHPSCVIIGCSVVPPGKKRKLIKNDIESNTWGVLKLLGRVYICGTYSTNLFSSIETQKYLQKQIHLQPTSLHQND